MIGGSEKRNRWCVLNFRVCLLLEAATFLFLKRCFCRLLGYLFQILKLYKRFIKAESFGKALVYQKKYLLSLLGGFQDCESTTLAMISQMGVYPTNADRSYRRRGIRTFRTVARAVLMVQRMNFLVNKSKRVSIEGSCESTSRSHVVNGGVSKHTVYQAPASSCLPRSSSDVAHAVPTLNLYQNGGVAAYTDRYSPRSDRRTYERHDIGVNGDLDSKSRSVKPSTTASRQVTGLVAAKMCPSLMILYRIEVFPRQAGHQELTSQHLGRILGQRRLHEPENRQRLIIRES